MTAMFPSINTAQNMQSLELNCDLRIRMTCANYILMTHALWLARRMERPVPFYISLENSKRRMSISFLLFEKNASIKYLNTLNIYLPNKQIFKSQHIKSILTNDIEKQAIFNVQVNAVVSLLLFNSEFFVITYWNLAVTKKTGTQWIFHL